MNRLALALFIALLMLFHQSALAEWVIYKGSVSGRYWPNDSKRKSFMYTWVAVKYNFASRIMEDHMIFHLSKSSSRGHSLNYDVRVSTAPEAGRDVTMILFRRLDSEGMEVTYSLSLKGRHKDLTLARSGIDLIQSFPGSLNGIEIGTAPREFYISTWVMNFSERLSREVNENNFTHEQILEILDREAIDLAKKLKRSR